MIHLVLGFARSGKSQFAEQQFHNCDDVTYIATAQALDGEMQSRIAHHQQQRNQQWRTIESPIDLATTLAALRGQKVMVDCLTVWLSNLMHQQAMHQLDLLTSELTQHWQQHGQLVMVSNEVGGGIVPLGELTRRYVDEHGRMNQRMATIANQVHWVVAGIPTQLK
ncbi:bifunctional adenosylcobinamide kinase/adenosylcobinamide-phosphate guanylyltransferase [Salinibius halmophilus]|uniref:bifunctional adenosylcobinamide kinase/adenosylcobinamide-phosphate guanylyltransferase n=1 Tax=Salinibius halmophilus TaxID=1853216 RepID=UPI000E674381|nr:bifunctional adenosylcobinamide kinase/adenosylcobinamide-phosphate guanylyltransferase [Salinibius halmophilus]